MIRIDRAPTAAPARLLKEGPAEVVRLRGLRTLRPLTKDDFPRWYGDDEIKQALWRMQHEKCCYCEREQERTFATVEHYRPKTSATRDDGTEDEGYWWLAYRFENLFFACANCNHLKKTHFPLTADNTPLPAEQDPWTAPHDERPLLLDPAHDDPAHHLTYVKEPRWDYQIAPLNGSLRGRKTIEQLELDRDDLTRSRRKYYRKHLKPIVDRYREAVQGQDDAGQATAVREAQKHVADDAQYALLARVVFRDAGLML